MTLHRARTEIAVAQSVSEIHECLRLHGARAILYEYDAAGEVEALKFQVPLGDQELAFRLPVDWQAVQLVLTRQRPPKAARPTEAQAKRVIWRLLREWVYAQCALLECEMVTLPQVFLPFALTPGGQTLYERWRDGRFVLPEVTRNGEG